MIESTLNTLPLSVAINLNKFRALKDTCVLQVLPFYVTSRIIIEAMIGGERSRFRARKGQGSAKLQRPNIFPGQPGLDKAG